MAVQFASFELGERLALLGVDVQIVNQKELVPSIKFIKEGDYCG